MPSTIGLSAAPSTRTFHSLRTKLETKLMPIADRTGSKRSELAPALNTKSRTFVPFRPGQRSAVGACQVERVDQRKGMSNMDNLRIQRYFLLEESLDVTLSVQMELQARVIEQQNRFVRNANVVQKRRVKGEIPLNSL